MPMTRIPELVVNGKKLWDTWSIRAFIILSLSLQTFLILLGPLRKRTSNKVIAFLIWSAYLLADWVAIFVVGHIATSEIDSQLPGFWAPFLLLHLGGPDTITALNLEDNSLWVRHLLSLFLQVSTTGYILFQTFLPGSKLLVPAILIFISGILKYFERTRALYLASIGQYRNSILEDSSKSTSDPLESTHFREGVDLGNCEVAVKHAYTLYKMSRGVIVDLVLRLDERKIREFFQNIVEPEDALKLLSIELNFFYDALYTKAVVVSKVLGFVFRCVVCVNVTVALVLFVTSSKDTYRKFDVKLTYALLFGAIALEGIALLMILFSDWSVTSAVITKFKNPRLLTRILNCFTINWDSCYCNLELAIFPKYIPLLFRRWSESISSYSLFFSAAPPKMGLLDRCLPQSVVKLLLRFYRVLVKILSNYVVGKSGLRDEIGALKHVHSTPISKELWKFIFLELQEKSKAKRIIGATGEGVLTKEFKDDCEEIWSHIAKPEHDQVLLMWNIATELCFYVDLLKKEERWTERKERDFSKTLSDYVLYLLIMQPSMMSAVAGETPLRYRDTCRYTFKDTRKKIKQDGETYKRVIQFSTHIQVPRARLGVELAMRAYACRAILEKVGSGSASKSNSHGRDRSKSVLMDACILANKLRDLDVEKRWTIMSKVWVEILSYAAAHCKGEAHAKALSRGGELITFVWLLMIHLGISQSARIEVSVTA